MKKPWNIPPGSQGCAGAGRGYVRRRPRRGQGGKLLLAVVTLVQVALSLTLAVVRRQQVIQAVKTPDGEGARVLLTVKKETKS